MASARKRPISASPLAEMVPTWAISSFEVTFFEFFLRSSMIDSTARSTPRLRSIGFMPAATALEPSLTIAAASTVAVVVPSPAMSEVFEATSRTIWAPMFSNLSSSSISLATVTPSLVMRGAPKLLSSTTLRPFGPSVTRTALARISTPRSIFSRASPAKRTSLAAMLNFSVSLKPHPQEHSRSECVSKDGRKGDCFRVARAETLACGGLLRTRQLRSGEHAHDVGLLHDQELLAVELDLGAGPLAEQHPVADLDVERGQLAVLVAPARADADDLALLRLLLRGVGDDDAAGGLLLGLDAAHDDAVVQGT